MNPEECLFMRIAVVDLLFSWPPHGGADVDVYYVMQELMRLGYDTHLFVTAEEGSWERGDIRDGALPFPVTLLELGEQGLTEAFLHNRLYEAVAGFSPDIVFLTQGYFLKTALIEALKGYPIISRCYAHELSCHKDILRFREGTPCPHCYVESPDICRRCALASQRESLFAGTAHAWTREYVESRAWTKDYYSRFKQAMAQCSKVIVTTEHMRAPVELLTKEIAVIPNGVDIRRFLPSPERAGRPVPVLFVPGRIEDPAKGFSLFLEAAEKVSGSGIAFEVRATLPEGYEGPPWLKAVGKLDYDSMPQAYRNTDICVVPSLWEEPFGLVALEAMASGIAVCASRTGGLQDIVVHGETGFLFERGNSRALAACLERLLEDRHLCAAMGARGRQRAEDVYDWEHIVSAYYPPLLDEISRMKQR